MPGPGSGKSMDKPDNKATGGQQKPNEKPNPDAKNGASEKEKADPDAKGAGGEEDPKQDENAKGGGKGKDEDQNKDADKSGSGSGKARDEKAKAEAMAKQAERNSETGKTVLDILQSVIKSTDPADKDVIAKVEELLKDQKLEETVARMQTLPDQLRDGRYGDAKVTAADSADRWEATALRLTTAFRELSAPRLEELLNAEQKLQDLRDRLDKLQNEQDVTQWLAEAGRLMEQLEKLKVGEKLREELKDLLEKAGWGEDLQRFRLRGGGWVLTNRGNYDAPAGYIRVVRDLTEEVQAHIQELILGDLLSSQDEAAPPQYQQLIERYYQVLATGKNKKP